LARLTFMPSRLSHTVSSSASSSPRRRGIAPRRAFLAAVVASWLALMGSTSTASLAHATAASSLAAKAKPGPSANGATWGIGPASKTKLDGRPDFKYFVTAGAVLHDHVAIENLSKKPLTLSLYARDATNGRDGQLGLQPRAAKPADAGAWITIRLPKGASRLRVPARSVAIVPFVVNVPRNAAPGDHTGGIISSLSAKVTTKKGPNVNPILEQRVAVAVAIRVSGPVHARLAVEGLGGSYAGKLNPLGKGTATLTYRVVNTGNVNLAAHQQISVHGLFGSTENIPAANVPVLLPGHSATVTLHVPGVFPEVLMSARVVLTPLVPSGDVDSGLSAAEGSARFFAIPWALLVILVLVVAAVVTRVRQRKSRRRQRSVRGASPLPGEGPAAGSVRPGTT
jgi:hypothetical protein